MRVLKTGNTQESFMITYIQTKYFLIQSIVNSERVLGICIKMSEDKKRTNFSSTEKTILEELVMQYFDILENKKSDSVSAATKKRKWEEVADEFSNNNECCKVCIVSYYEQ